MNTKLKTGLYLIILILLILGSPSENRFQQRLQADFGTLHGGMSLDISRLNEMGSSKYQSYLLFSKYEYAFGEISVSYLGMGFMTFYLGNNIIETAPRKKLPMS